MAAPGARRSRRRGWLAATASAAILAGAGTWYVLSDGPSRPPGLIVPELTPAGRAGQAAYDLHCAACHGPSAAGTPSGPPLVHPVYRSAHHADTAFALAVRRGVRAHHWRHGDMPPLPHVGDGEVRDITRYVRELQRANGIP